MAKPQYKTLVKTLDELCGAALFVLRNNEADLTAGHNCLRQATQAAQDVVQHGKAALAKKKERIDANQR